MIPGGQRWIEYRSRADVIRLHAFGDLHHGNRNCAEERLAADLAAFAADEQAIGIGMGDYADYISYQDRRFDPEAISPKLTIADLGKLGRKLTGDVREMLWPARQKFVGLLMGNHEKKYEVATGQEHLHAWLCTELGVPNLGYCCFVDLIFVRNPRARRPFRILTEPPPRRNSTWKVRVFAHHGAGYAQTPGGKLNRLISFMDYFQADLTLCAHVHDEASKKLVRLGANPACTKLTETVQVGAITGSYLRTYGEGTAGYGEQKGYRPVPLGCTVVQLEPNKRQIRVTI